MRSIYLILLLTFCISCANGKENYLEVNGKRVKFFLSGKEEGFSIEPNESEVRIIHDLFMPLLVKALTQQDYKGMQKTLFMNGKYGFYLHGGGLGTLYQGQKAISKFRQYIAGEVDWAYRSNFKNLFEKKEIEKICFSKFEPKYYTFHRYSISLFSKTHNFIFFVTLNTGGAIITGFEYQKL